MDIKELIFYYQSRFFGKNNEEKLNQEYLNEIQEIRMNTNLDEIDTTAYSENTNNKQAS
ncbi:hypothetical protein [Aquimarina agarivorans]|uniref:hypothetical protein n=1 Tax=Aquimarina agarivorans TaxID=980584 RepID=UPI000311D491|nr:hypothetical protein [Aquimarina agarivorans]